MFKYELKRILKSRVFIILTVLALAYYSYLTISYFINNSEGIAQTKKDAQTTNSFLSETVCQAAEGESPYDALKKTYLEAENEWNRLAADGFGEDGKMSGDMLKAHNRWYICMRAFNSVSYKLDEYPAFTSTAIKKAYIISEDQTQDKYTIRLNQKAVEEYNVVRDFSLIDTTPASVWHEMYTARYEYFYIFLVFAFVILSADVLCCERTHRLCGIVFTSKNGRKSLLMAKLCSLGLIAAIIIAVITVADISVCYSVMGKELMLEPIQALPAYKSSTADLSFFSLILYCSLVRLILLLFAAGMAAAVSVISRNVFSSVIINAMVMFAGFAACIYASGYEIFDENSAGVSFDATRYELYEKLRAFLPVCLTDPTAYIDKFDCINIAQFPVERIAACLCVTAILSAVFITLAFCRFGKASKAVRLTIKKG